MSLSFNPESFNLAFGVIRWLVVVTVVAGVAGVTLTLMSLAAVGRTGPLLVLQHLREGFADLFGTSFRRIMALTKLTFLEAVRRKTLWVFAVFAVLFLFAGWFMSGVTQDPALQVKAYVSFVLRTISWLILPVVMLLACWGLPEDIKARSLHTVVTKPVRRHEIVLGRIFGFTLIGGGVLAAMGAVGYVWIVRQLPSSMREQLVARVPIYGDVRFLDREGSKVGAGINVGDENPFRSFVEGNTNARAIWDFENVTPARLDGGELVIESSFHSFRTHKGDMKRGLACQYTLINDARNLRVPLEVFYVEEFRRNTYKVKERNKTLTDANNQPVDLERDVLHDGKLTVEVACLSGGQLLGMARPDLFIRLPDRSFAAGYFKTVGSLGLMVIMVVVLGVVAGCFAKGPVATLLTAFVVIVGRVAHDFMEDLTSGVTQKTGFRMDGRGVFDSIFRIPTHKTPNVPLEESALATVINALDNLELAGLWAVQQVFPDLGTFDTTEYVANAFDVPWAESLLPSLAVTVGYCIPWIVIGYFSLKVRELEAK